MNDQPKSIEDHISCLARLTGAPGTFVDQVRSLFTSKGISLETEATPFLRALDEAFKREESIRAGSVHAQDQVTKLRDSFRRVGQAYVEQLTQLKKVRSSLQRQARTAPNQPQSGQRRSSTTTRVTIPGDHRSLVLRPEREELPMVPGPKDPQ
jgi:hypothetical protein